MRDEERAESEQRGLFQKYPTNANRHGAWKQCMFSRESKNIGEIKRVY